MSIKHLISSLSELYKKMLNNESTKEVDFLLEALHEKGEAIRKKDIGFWDINGTYKEDYQEITKLD
jgi:hypothetical protein